MLVKKHKYTELVQYLAYKGFSPSQIRWICIEILKLKRDTIQRKVAEYVSRDWIEKAIQRFYRENIIKELVELGLYGKKKAR